MQRMTCRLQLQIKAAPRSLSTTAWGSTEFNCAQVLSGAFKRQFQYVVRLDKDHPGHCGYY